jgi:hypothetical protein
MTANLLNQQIIDYLTAPISFHMFTLVFWPGNIAVLKVHGAESLEEARAFACSLLPQVCYEVVDGDISNGHVGAFQAWTCIQAQESEEQSKRLSSLTDAELEQMCDETEATIDALLQIDPSQLQEQEEQSYQEQLREALALGERLELEQIRRIIERVYGATRQAAIQREEAQA